MTNPIAANYRTLTFDCYGTLIDWENGILGYLQPLLESYDVHVIDEWVLECFSEWEPQIQAAGGSYRSVLARILERFGNRLAFTPDDQALNGFADSIEFWQPFPDTVPALRSLAKEFSLAVVSNIDNDLFAWSAKNLATKFDHVITAEDTGTYKPDKGIFEAALKQVEMPVLHVAQSRFHDIVPASELGLDTVWIKGNHADHDGAAKAVPANPTWTFNSLAELVESISFTD